MKVTDILEDYSWTNNPKEQSKCLERMVKFISTSEDIDTQFLTVIKNIYPEDYSKFIGYLSHLSHHKLIVEPHLQELIHGIPINDFANFIHILKTYYPEIKLANYQDLFEQKIENLCMRTDCYHQFQEITDILKTGIFLYPIEHYLVENLLVYQLENTYQVSFRGENKNDKNEIYKLLYELELQVQKESSSYQIEYVDFGSTCIVLKIGNYVIKFGSERTFNERLEHPSILKPLYYQYFSDSNMVVEIQPFIDTVDIPPFVEYDIIVVLYEDGIAWLDSGIRNIGRQQDGTYVVCDRDYLYDINELDVEQQKQAIKLYQRAKTEMENRNQKLLKKAIHA